jgi:hypothetical protein
MEGCLERVEALACGSEISAAEAKHDYFLTPDDLRVLPSRPLGVWGAGNTRLYRPQDLLAAALAKYGAEGLKKKREAREKREDKKRKREEDAAAAAEQLRAGESLAPLTAKKSPATKALPPTPSVAAGAAADDSAVRALIAEARRALKGFCTWEVLRSKNAPHGTSVSVSLPRGGRVGDAHAMCAA